MRFRNVISFWKNTELNSGHGNLARQVIGLWKEMKTTMVASKELSVTADFGPRTKLPLN